MTTQTRPDAGSIRALLRDNNWVGVLAQADYQSSFCGRGSASWADASDEHQQWHRDQQVRVGQWMEWVFGPVEEALL